MIFLETDTLKSGSIEPVDRSHHSKLEPGYVKKNSVIFLTGKQCYTSYLLLSYAFVSISFASDIALFGVSVLGYG